MNKGDRAPCLGGLTFQWGRQSLDKQVQYIVGQVVTSSMEKNWIGRENTALSGRAAVWRGWSGNVSLRSWLFEQTLTLGDFLFFSFDTFFTFIFSLLSFRILHWSDVDPAGLILHTAGIFLYIFFCPYHFVVFSGTFSWFYLFNSSYTRYVEVIFFWDSSGLLGSDLWLLGSVQKRGYWYLMSKEMDGSQMTHIISLCQFYA